MSITLLPPAPDPAADSPSDFSTKAAAFVLAQKAMVPQINEVLAQMNSIAAGGAMAIPYVFVGPGNFTPGVGRAAFLGLVGAQNTATQIALDHTSAGGSGVQSLISAMDDSTSVIKGYLRLARPSDPSKFLVFAVTGQADFGYYSILFGSVINSGGNSNPFAVSDSVGASFTPTGDKGDTGITYMKVSERRAFGWTAPALGTSGFYARELNTVEANTIAGASLSGGVISLPPGRYNVRARAPAYGTIHQLQIWEASAGVRAVGSSARALAGNPGHQSDSFVSGEFPVGANGIYLNHLINGVTGGASLGQALAPSGYFDVLAEFEIWKVA